jgi:HTH-type transcriptional regulator/antitoxin HipB
MLILIDFHAIFLEYCSFMPLIRGFIMEKGEDRNKIASLIRFHRKRAGLSQVELASLSGVSRKVVQELEAGHDGATWRNLSAILGVLNVKLEPQGPLVEEWKNPFPALEAIKAETGKMP